MKKLSTLYSRLFIAAAMSTVVMGVQAQSNSSSLYAPGSTYIEFGVGQSDYSLENGIGAFGSDQGDTAYSLRGGAYFNTNLGMELGVINFGTVNRAGGTTKAQGINLSLIGKMPVNANFNLLGKIGTTYSHTEVSSNPASGIVAGTQDDFGLSYGIGAEYLFTPQWSGVLQYESQDMKFAGDRTDRVGVTSLSARYRF